MISASSWISAGPRRRRTRLGVRLAGLPAKAVTRGYHLLSMPVNRTRIAADWVLDAVFPRQLVELGVVRSPAVLLTAGTPEHPALSGTASAGE